MRGTIAKYVGLAVERTIGPLLKGLSRVFGGAFSKVFSFFKGILGRLFDKTITMTSWMTKLALILQAIFALVSIVPLALSVFFQLGDVWNVIDAIVNPTDAYMSRLRDILYDVLGQGGIGGVLASVDSLFSSATSGTFVPALTLSGLFCQLGVSHFWNSLVSASISGIMFLLSLALFRWSLNRLKFTWVRSLK